MLNVPFAFNGGTVLVDLLFPAMAGVVRETREALYDAVETLRYWPDYRNVKALTGHEWNLEVIAFTYESTSSVCCGKQRLSFESEPWLGRWERAEAEQSVVLTYEFSPIFLVFCAPLWCSVL